MKQKTKIVLLGLFLLLTGHNISVAQVNDVSQGCEEVVICSDPIVEMLDSLVMLNNVIRFNNSMSTASIDPSMGAPFYDDNVYRERISQISTPIPLVYNQQVKNYISLYADKRRALTGRVLGLSQLYFPMFEEILDKEGLPLEFKYLSVVESALNPIAKSRVGATGIWQFMLNTGKIYDLKVTSYIDERKDPLKATYAACKYFRDMYDIYHDWLLVIAAYNCGAGNVNRAIIRSGGKTNFWEISQYLPKETRGYVPAFIAVCYVMNYAAEHNIVVVEPAFSYFEVDTLRIHKRTTLNAIAKNTELPLDVVCYLNPVYKKGVVPESVEAQIIRLPANKIAAFIANENNIYTNDLPEVSPVYAMMSISPKSSDDVDGYKYSIKKAKTTHTVRRGETLSELADMFDCTTAEIKKINHLKSNKIHKGQKLKVMAYVKVKNPVSQKEKKETSAVTKEDSVATTTSSEKIPVQYTGENQSDQPKYIFHLVQRGDTLWNIARRYEGATVDQIMELNKIADNKSLKAGTKIKVMIAG